MHFEIYDLKVTCQNIFNIVKNTKTIKGSLKHNFLKNFKQDLNLITIYQKHLKQLIQVAHQVF